jgi:hypothetical protein
LFEGGVVENPFEKAVQEVELQKGKIVSLGANKVNQSTGTDGSGQRGAKIGEIRQRADGSSWRKVSTTGDRKKDWERVKQGAKKVAGKAKEGFKKLMGKDDESIERKKYEKTYEGEKGHQYEHYEDKHLESHVKNTETQDLKKFVEYHGHDKSMKRLLDHAKNELKNRTDENPFENKKEGGETKKEKESSKEVGEEKGDESEGKDEKPEKDDGDKESGDGDKESGDGEKEEKKITAKDVEKMSPQEKKKHGIKKMPDGEYNPETGAGWSADKGIDIDDESKKRVAQKPRSVKNQISHLVSPESAKLMSFVDGKAGTGKSYNIGQAVEDMGYEKVDTQGEFNAEDYEENGAYVELKGARYNYSDFLTTLFKYNGTGEGKPPLLSFDDSDNMLFDKNVQNMLKTLEGTDPEIQIGQTYKKKIADALGIDRDEVPDSFTFNGRLNFISNKDLGGSEDMKALFPGRANKTTMDFDNKEMLYSMSRFIDKVNIAGKKLPFKQAKEYYDFMKENQDFIPEGNLQARFFGTIHDYKNIFDKDEDLQEDFDSWQDYAKFQLKEYKKDKDKKTKGRKIKKAFGYLVKGEESDWYNEEDEDDNDDEEENEKSESYIDEDEWDGVEEVPLNYTHDKDNKRVVSTAPVPSRQRAARSGAISKAFKNLI